MTALDTPSALSQPSAPPFSRALRVVAGASLVLAGLLNGGLSYLGHFVVGDRTFSEQIEWAQSHGTWQRFEQTGLLLSSLFLLLGVLGIAHVTRQRSPRLTAVGAVLAVLGMWGFHNVLAMGYVSGTVAPTVLPVADAVRLNDALSTDAGTVVTALVPHLLGSFFGLVLLSVAAWRSQRFSRLACVLLVAFLVWDFLLPPVGPLEAHLLLLVAFCWFGVDLLRMPQRRWRGVVG